MEQREQSQACLDSAESRQNSTFRQMRRKRQQLSEEESIDILKKGTAGTLALLGDNGYPYALPISYVYSDGKLYFHSALSGHKIDAIRNCDKASFCVIAQDEIQPKKYTTYYRSVIVFGRIHIIEDENEKLETARLLGNKYNPNDEESLQKELEHGFARMLMIRFDIEHLTGKEAIELVKHQRDRQRKFVCLADFYFYVRNYYPVLPLVILHVTSNSTRSFHPASRNRLRTSS
ncbi:MAG: NimIJ family nitroimidazole resistance protein [Prevotella sp.]|nr:NimIJ family nitroimidazole resistance protein [Prevotella sp.]